VCRWWWGIVGRVIAVEGYGDGDLWIECFDGVVSSLSVLVSASEMGPRRCSAGIPITWSVSKVAVSGKELPADGVVSQSSRR